MSKITFEEAKQLVAEKRNCRDFDYMMAVYEGLRSFRGEKTTDDSIQSAYSEAAELLAKSWANEAVKEDRNKIIEGNPSDIFPSINGDVAKINMIKLNKIPLPYPEIKK